MHKQGEMVHVCNPSTREGKAERLVIQDYIESSWPAWAARSQANEKKKIKHQVTDKVTGQKMKLSTELILCN